MELKNHLKKDLGTAFNYQSKSHLLEAQEALVSLAKRLLKYIDQLSQDLHNSCYELLYDIVKRPEFGLNCMGFDNLTESLKSKATTFKLIKHTNENLRHFKSQILVAQKYEKFLYDCLAMVMGKIDDMALSSQETNFVAAYLAIAFFRIPLFRKKLLSSLPIPNQKLTMNEYEKSSNAYFFSHFDWETEFYEVLNEDKRSGENKEFLRGLLDRQLSLWEERFNDNELIFLFTSEYFKYIQRTIHSKEMMPWSFLPGYPSIKALFLQCIEKHDFETLPPSLVEAITSLLPDENLFKTVFNIVIFKIEFSCCKLELLTLTAVREFLL